ncbi:MAG: M28 family peptidase [Deltaproteobacteria bacterium]|nr:M28 family peptidase [Candidatus Zymogenaceae bacterium]
MDEVISELGTISRERAERCNSIALLFERLGATNVIIEPVSTDGEPSGGSSDCPGNVIVSLEGGGEGWLIISAHLDSAGEGMGVLDNYSGMLMAAALYRGLSDEELNHNLLFVIFDLEEAGLLGSIDFACNSDCLPKEIHAMVNLECLGMTMPHPWPEGSSDVLEDIFVEVGGRFGYDASPGSITGVAADSLVFLALGVPAITIDGVNECDLDILGSERDVPEVIDNDVLMNSYPVIEEYIRVLDDLAYPLDPANVR